MGLTESLGRRALRVQFSQESLRRYVGDSWKYCSWGHGLAAGDGPSRGELQPVEELSTRYRATWWGCEREGEPPGYPKHGEVGNAAQAAPAAPHQGVMDVPVVTTHCKRMRLAGRWPCTLLLPRMSGVNSQPGVNKGFDSQVTLSWLVLWGWEQGGSLQPGASTVWVRKGGQEPPVKHSPWGGGGGAALSLLCCPLPHRPRPSSHPCHAPAKGTDAPRPCPGCRWAA